LAYGIFLQKRRRLDPKGEVSQGQQGQMDRSNGLPAFYSHNHMGW